MKHSKIAYLSQDNFCYNRKDKIDTLFKNSFSFVSNLA
ncbi:hypothetical protein STRPS_0089 [Streptococcus pseudoporcinus LQ 940-04]|uniref:Uncharacterized protein n=1 Tax=Streptococcus pseudoporcinus LQ 940-04 TaxID=875093 RepID=G5K6K2_9STRE|nr:hypothetical protein HMPREF9320_1506 [Streptococcus pseudoporcinus SPIN 20026]EHI65898.1 hypothetical protein STRPS_0089 [Streptococcus pseudoporcinus LQ 940-04]